MNASFYILAADQSAQGPFTLEQLRHMWRTGQVKRDTLYCQQGFADWLPLDALEELRGPAVPPAPAWRSESKVPKAPTMDESVAAGILRAVSVLGAISLIIGLIFFFLRAVL